MKFVERVFKVSGRTAQWTKCVSIVKTNHVLLFTETIIVCCVHHTIYKYNVTAKCIFKC